MSKNKNKYGEVRFTERAKKIEGEDLDFVSIDDWKPVTVNKAFRHPSIWRAKQNENHPPAMPGRDDLKKIKSYIKNGVFDSEIMRQFNITQKVLDFVKTNTIKAKEIEIMSNPRHEVYD